MNLFGKQINSQHWKNKSLALAKVYVPSFRRKTWQPFFVAFTSKEVSTPQQLVKTWSQKGFLSSRNTLKSLKSL